jgi:hypothetical protein
MSILRLAELWRLDSGRAFADVMEPWQRDFLIEATSTAPDGRAKYRRVLCSIPRQSSKTELMALYGCWRTLTAGGATISIATDLDQCRLQHARLVRAIRRSPMIAREFDTSALKGGTLWRRDAGGYWTFLSSDEASAGGHVVATLLADEIGQFAKGSWPFIAQVSPSPAVASGQTFFAGFKGPIQHRTAGAPLFDLLEQLNRAEPSLFGLNVEGRSPASWHTDEFLDEQKRTLPPSVFARLYMNAWSEGEDQFLSVRMVDGATDESLNLGDVRAADERVCLGLDLGLVSDRAVLTASALHPTRGARQIRSRVWQGSHERPVDLQAVENQVKALYHELRAGLLLLDPWQGRQMEQRLAKAGLRVMVYNFTGPSVERLAAGVYGAFANGRVRIPADLDLREELLSLTVKQTTSGYRWQHPSGGHDDRVMALALSMWPLIEPPAPAEERIVIFNPLEMLEMRGVLE